MTGWTLEPSYPLSQTPKFQYLLREDGQTPEWCEGDAPISHGGSWMPNTGQGPDWPDASASFLWQTLEGGVLPQYCLSPRPILPLPAPCTAGGLPAPGGDRGPVLETGGRVPVTRPFQGFRMRGAAKEGEQTAFQNSFGFPTDPFPTLLAGTVTPFAFWYEDDPAGGCIRFPTELECERLMGLPEGWTKYGADGREISASQRYKALGNAIALPCAEYIMAGIAEALR